MPCTFFHSIVMTRFGVVPSTSHRTAAGPSGVVLESVMESHQGARIMFGVLVEGIVVFDELSLVPLKTRIGTRPRAMASSMAARACGW